MPTYEYQCHCCEKRFEEFKPISSAPYASCPKCQTEVKRLISGGTGIIFKGSGFYLTDYKNKKMPLKKGETKAIKKNETIAKKSDSKSEKK